MNAIVKQLEWPKLKYLNVSESELFDEGISVLSLGKWPLLESLNLSNTGISSKGAEEIVKQSKWPKLKYLNVSNNYLFDQGILELTSGEWPLLENLNLSNTKISEKIIEIIVNKSKWPHLLKHLDISNNDILDDGLLEFSLAQWPLIEDLNIKNTKINNTSYWVKELLEQRNLRNNLCNLKKLNISQNVIVSEDFLERRNSGVWPLLQSQVLSDGENTSELMALSSNRYEDEQPLLMTLFDFDWLDPHQIHLSISPDAPNQNNIFAIPLERWNKIESIHISFNSINKIEPNQLVTWPPNLKILDLSNNLLSDDDNKIYGLLSQRGPQLEELNLQNINMSSGSLQTILRISDWASLKRLDISLNPIQDEGIEILSSFKRCQITDLNLSSTKITGQGLKNFMKKKEWNYLRKLDISLNFIESEALEVFVNRNWPFLEDLNLQNTKITAKGIKVLLSRRPSLPILKILNISCNPIGNEGLEIFASPDWSLWEHLNLRDTEITEKGVEVLMRNSQWRDLKWLDISDNKIGNEGVKALCSGKWPLLESLNLSNINMTGRGLGSMVKISQWSRLKTLDLSHNDLFNDESNVLQKGNWPSVESLNLNYTSVVFFGERWMEEASWPLLKEIHMLGCQYTQQVPSIRNLVNLRWPDAKLTISA